MSFFTAITALPAVIALFKIENIKSYRKSWDTSFVSRGVDSVGIYPTLKRINMKFNSYKRHKINKKIKIKNLISVSGRL